MNPQHSASVYEPLALTAEQATAVRWLNAYLRETEYSPASSLEAPSRLELVLELPLTQRVIFLCFTYWSVSGHHRYRFPIRGLEAGRDTTVWLDGLETIDWLLSELAASDQEQATVRNRASRLWEQVLNSIEKTEQYRRKRRLPEREGSSPPDPLIQSEQALVYGHPFHPTPKSSEGFTGQDLVRYAPELGACFPLVYWAVHPEWFEERWLSGWATHRSEWHDWEHQAAAAVAGDQAAAEGFRLLPCHPWQSAYLNSLETIRRGLREGKLIAGRRLGRAWYPTSSVRTVWSELHSYYLKLPLHVRITNFIRLNDDEQRRRSLDAARIWQAVEQSFADPKFGVLPEFGYVSIGEPEIRAETTVLFRAHTPALHSGRGQWHMAASLLEDEAGASPWLPRD